MQEPADKLIAKLSDTLEQFDKNSGKDPDLDTLVKVGRSAVDMLSSLRKMQLQRRDAGASDPSG